MLINDEQFFSLFSIRQSANIFHYHSKWEALEPMHKVKAEKKCRNSISLSSNGIYQWILRSFCFYYQQTLFLLLSCNFQTRKKILNWKTEKQSQTICLFKIQMFHFYLFRSFCYYYFHFILSNSVTFERPVAFRAVTSAHKNEHTN